MWKWARRRHTRKSKFWIKRKYFRSKGNDNWTFSELVKNDASNVKYYIDLVKASSVKIQRHIKIKAEATPYDPKYIKYFKERDTWKSIYRNY